MNLLIVSSAHGFNVGIVSNSKAENILDNIQE